ncbi:hypothetical protein [Brevibacillus centrosporus]|uniref:hypothetical protein n=1 Tax=Brevibacillus centrosporus TaxID=54910 RepID=UPI002E207051|nr:hypothetical protein [Brevibacillus centrosporus]
MQGIQKIKNGRFRVTLDHGTCDGVRKQVYKTVITKAEAEKILIEFEDNKRLKRGVSI